MKILKYSLILIIQFFAIQTFSQVLLDEVITVIGDEMIKESDILNQVVQLNQKGTKVTEGQKCKLLEDLLFQKILLDQAKIDSIEVSDAEIDEEISRRIDMFTGEAGSMSKLEDFYGKTELEIKTEWRPLVKEQILAQRMQNSIISSIQITPNEIQKFYVALNKDSLPIIPMQYEFAQIIIQPKITNEDEKAIKEKLEAIRQRAIKGESFSKLAVLYSDDTESAKNGGELGGFMSRGELVPEFSAVAFKLKEGEISRIVKTDFGYHIIQLIELRGEKAKIKHILLRPRQSQVSMQNAMNTADSVYAQLKDTLTFAQAAKLYSNDPKTKNNGGVFMNPYSGTSKFQVEAIEPSILYTLKDLKPGEFSEPFVGYDNTGVQVYKIVKLISVSQEHKANLTEDYDQIKAYALGSKKEEALTKWVTNKIAKTYIKFQTDRYNSCDFKYKWIK